MRFRIIGPGRAGGAFARALTQVGWELDRSYGRHRDVSAAAAGVPILLICVPDRAVASVAAAVSPGDAVVLHVAGSLGLDVLAEHERIGSVHPLMTMPDAERGAARLLDSCHFAVAGDPVATAIVEALGGLAFTVEDEQRTLYHATAAVASNHLVALTAQVARLATAAGVPAEAFWPLMAASLTNVAETDPATALTGPAARADWETVRRHRTALATLAPAAAPAEDLVLYETLAAAAARLAGHEPPEDLS
ncbi:MAG: DUF2520 domain-containing protein [Actinomycetota bacterium]